jgi:hypothetical protein
MMTSATPRLAARSGKGVDRTGAGVGEVVGVELTFLEQGETGLFQCAAGWVVVGLRRGHDHVNIRIRANTRGVKEAIAAGPMPRPHWLASPGR